MAQWLAHSTPVDVQVEWLLSKGYPFKSGWVQLHCFFCVSTLLSLFAVHLVVYINVKTPEDTHTNKFWKHLKP